MRLHDSPLPVIGLTGGIATGKSTVSKILQENGYFVIDADQIVKEIYKRDETKVFIASIAPEAIKNANIDFAKLREIFFNNPQTRTSIESFLYQRMPEVFREKVTSAGQVPFVIYDVPLLFEKSLDQKVDKTIVVYAPRKIQIQRLMKRDGHLEEMAKKIMDHQMDIEEKKQKADFIVNNSGTVEELAEEVKQLLRQLKI